MSTSQQSAPVASKANPILGPIIRSAAVRQREEGGRDPLFCTYEAAFKSIVPCLGFPQHRTFTDITIACSAEGNQRCQRAAARQKRRTAVRTGLFSLKKTLRGHFIAVDSSLRNKGKV